MHESDDDAEFKAFVKQSLISFNANICYLMETLKFTVQRVQSMEASLNIKVVTPVEAESRNLNEDIMKYDEVVPSIDTSSSVIIQQRKTIEELKAVNKMQQNRLKTLLLLSIHLSSPVALFKASY